MQAMQIQAQAMAEVKSTGVCMTCRAVLLQVLQSQAQAIAEAGFTSVWMPPPSDAVSDQGYLPRDLYNLDSKYGSQAELRNCISVIHENNLKAIADIVINHRCAHAQVCVRRRPMQVGMCLDALLAVGA